MIYEYRIGINQNIIICVLKLQFQLLYEHRKTDKRKTK